MVTSRLVVAAIVPQRVGSQISPAIFTCPFLRQAAGCRQRCLTDGLRWWGWRLWWGRLRLWLTCLRGQWLGLWSVGSRRVNWKWLSNAQHFRSRWCLAEKRGGNLSRERSQEGILPCTLQETSLSQNEASWQFNFSPCRNKCRWYCYMI